MSLIYLASPYSHEDPKVRKKRFDINVEVAAMLSYRGYLIYSPIVHGHYITEFLIQQGKKDYYLFSCNEKICTEMIRKCDSFFILTLDGWMESIGVKVETELANKLNLPINFVTVNGTIKDRI